MRKKQTSVPSAIFKTSIIHLYMKDISNCPLLAAEEERRLSERLRGKDRVLREEARSTLVNSNLRLVVRIARDFKGMGLPFPDLVSEGNLGLMRAAETFDLSMGARFSSYAALWIKQYMRRALCSQTGAIRVPIQAMARIGKLKRTELELTDRLGRIPTDAELAAALSIQERTVSDIRLSNIKTTSIHAPVRNGEDGCLEDFISDRNAVMPDEALNRKESLRLLSRHLKALDSRERMVICLRFGLDGGCPRTLDEISQLIHRTRERVRQIQNLALDKLRAGFSDEFAAMAS
jgi:RNA polymerase primary sigma factor